MGGWSSTFLAGLAGPTYRLRYVLEVVGVYQEPGTPGYSVGSHRGLGTATEARLVRNSIQVQGCTLSPRGWSSTVGSWSVGITGGIQELFENLTRGTIVALKAGFPGMSVGSFQTIAIGQVRNLRGRAPNWTLEVLDLLSALRTRLSADAGDHALFDDIPVHAGTTLAEDYTDGESELEVAATAAIVYAKQSGGVGLVRITPSGGGDPFYLAWTGSATGPIRLTGFSGAPAGMVGSDASGGALNGDALHPVAYIYGHPIDIARKILTLNGSGTYGVLPPKWNLGLDESFIDHDDCDLFRDDVANASGLYRWDVVSEETVEDGYSWLAGILALGAYFVTMRQGLITVRCAQDTQSPGVPSDIEITDADIAEVEAYEAFDGEHLPEYTTVEIDTLGPVSGGVTNAYAATLPAQKALKYDLSDVLFTNHSNVLAEMQDRVTESATRIPERITIRCAGLRLAELAPGDVPTLTTTRIHSRRDGAAGFQQRACLVTEVSPQWGSGCVRLTLLVYPESDGT